MSAVVAGDSCTLRALSHCKPSWTEPIQLGKQTYVMKWKHSHWMPNRAKPDRACSLAVCLFLLVSRRPILLHNRSNFQWLKCLFFTMSANTLVCEVVINAVHLRPALWEQSDKNYQNRDLKLKLWEEVTAECDSSYKQKCCFFYLLIAIQSCHVLRE